MTKEELDMLMGTLRLAFRDLTRGRLVLFEERENIVTTLEQLQAEFNRYIDVLEPLGEELRNCNCSANMTAKDYYTYVIQVLNADHRFDCSAVAKMLKRACDLIDAEKKPTDIQSVWNGLVLEVEQFKPMLATHLRDVKPIEMVCEHHPDVWAGLGTRVLRISVPRRAQHSLTRKLLERKENLQLLKDCLERVVGESMDIKITEPTCPHCGKEVER